VAVASRCRPRRRRLRGPCQLSGDWCTPAAPSPPRLDVFAELSPPRKGLAIAGLSGCDEATSNLESAEGRCTDAFRSARWPPNRTHRCSARWPCLHRCRRPPRIGRATASGASHPRQPERARQERCA